MAEQAPLEKVEQLSSILNRERLHPKALAFLCNRPSDEDWAIAVSGGVDSVALLYMLFAFFPERRGHLHVFHFNHCLRGAESDADEVLVQKICEELELRFHSGHWLREDFLSVSESVARDARLSFFQRKLMEEGISVLLTAHQKDDIAESLLMRIARGSGAEGLAAPRSVYYYEQGFSHYRVRPLLCLSKTEIETACRKSGIYWNEDASNQSSVFTRNRLRNAVIPDLIKAIPQNFIEGSARVREMQEEYAEFVALSSEPLLSELSLQKGKSLDLKAYLEALPKAQLRYVLSQWFIVNEVANQVSPQNFELILKALPRRDSLCFSISKELQLFCDSGVVSIHVSSGLRELCDEKFLPISLSIGSTLFFPNGNALKLDLVDLSDFLLGEILSGKVDCTQNCYLRYEEGFRFTASIWRTGDRYQAIGASGRSTLQDIFVNKKIPRKERRNLPIVRIEHDIAWCPNLPPAEAYKITKGLKQALKLTYIA